MNNEPGAPEAVAQIVPAAPPLTKSLLLNVIPPSKEEQYIAIRPPPPAPPEYAEPVQPLQPFFALPPLAVMRPDKTETEPARI